MESSNGVEEGRETRVIISHGDASLPCGCWFFVLLGPVLIWLEFWCGFIQCRVVELVRAVEIWSWKGRCCASVIRRPVIVALFTNSFQDLDARIRFARLDLFYFLSISWIDGGGGREFCAILGGEGRGVYVEGVIKTGCFLHLCFYVLNLTGNPTSYGYFGGSLQEFHWFKECYGSWFLGNYVCEGKHKSCLV